MDTSMTTRLILSKMDTERSKTRPLCLAIVRAVAHLEAKFEQEASSRFEFIEALAGAAARTLALHHIADCLVTNPAVLVEKLQWARDNRMTHFRLKHPGRDLPRYPIDHLTPISDSYIDSAPQDALIATLLTKRFQLANQLRKDGVDIRKRSPAFGEPLEAAAAMGAREAVQTILDDLRNSQRSSGKGFSRSIMLAVENGHEDVASLLLQQRTPVMLRGSVRHARRDLERRELRFWENLSKKAACHGCENILSIASESAARVRRENDWASEVEDTALGKS
jgi:hypothetical protein